MGLISDTILQELMDGLFSVCNPHSVRGFSSEVAHYGKDQTLDLQCPFDVVVTPESVAEVSAVMRLCNALRVPVTPRGGGSGVTGGALPLKRGIVLSMERLNQIIEINDVDQFAVAEAGVVSATLYRAVEEKGLFFPVKPSSSSTSFVGGNVAENSGAISTCKYGSTRQFVLNLEVVLPSGDVMWTGANVPKNCSGLDLTQLITGSEGVLAVITKVVYRLIRKPKFKVTICANFDLLGTAIGVIRRLKQMGLGQSAVELICKSALDLAVAYVGGDQGMNCQGKGARVIVDFDEDVEAALDEKAQAVRTLFLQFVLEDDFRMAFTAADRECLWTLRYSIGTALVADGRRYRDIDVSVPLSNLQEYLEFAMNACRGRRVTAICFGHAFDGNVHVMLSWKEGECSYDECLEIAREIYRYALSHGGAISGEHGIGIIQREFMNLMYTEAHLKLMRSVKEAFDPKGILNPGKLFP